MGSEDFRYLFSDLTLLGLRLLATGAGARRHLLGYCGGGASLDVRHPRRAIPRTALFKLKAERKSLSINR